MPNYLKRAKGVELVLKVGDGASPEAFTVRCTVNAQRSLKGTAQTNQFNIPDCDDMEAVAKVEREKVSVEWVFSGGGLLNTPDAQEFAEWLESPDPKNCQVILDRPAADGGLIWEGPFHMTDFEIVGERGGLVEANMSLGSHGAVTISANS